MSAIRHHAEHKPALRRGEGAMLLWITLYSALVIVLVGNHLYGRGLPLIDDYGRLALMASDRGGVPFDDPAAPPDPGFLVPQR